MPLYHSQIGFPEGISFSPIFGLTPTHHAREAASNDRYGKIELPKHFLPRKAKVVEIETDDKGNLIKILAREAMNDVCDIVYAFLVREKLIKTAWINRRNDKHFTLDHSKYAPP